MEVYQRLKDLREDADLTQLEAAKIAFLSKNTYIRYEKGETSIPLEIALRYADYYKVSLDYIAGVTNKKEGTGFIRTDDNIKKNKCEKAIKKILQAVNEIKEINNIKE